MSIHLSSCPTVLWLSECSKTALIHSSNPIKVERKRGPCSPQLAAKSLLPADSQHEHCHVFSVYELSLLRTCGILILQVKELHRCYLTPLPCEWR